ncbi:branched-chain amino acid transport system II carrier protein [Thermophilibacter provencensis]|uniref:Branched-chain amino acid transport system II carrier protein n=1 Tax=Thermophilibacter provencensis TaxID=1852386 RepID=A0ABT7V155_9ACTN|nr:branched-chain amino acid transport system II carrier protein [Thermophilibacter provencensis]MDM8270349.1 branched-chain amino acid transport system II carrier protein [Thermophilibacter provencensis]
METEKHDGSGAAASRGGLAPRQTLFVGITLFSMFFGAGNLILPPLLGVQAGREVLPALVGFFVTGVGLPVLGIVAVALSGTLRELAARVHPLFSRFFVALVYLAIGPCLAIPRTASTAFEMLSPLLGDAVSPEVARLVFSVAFFALAYVLAMHPGRLTRLLGRFTGPALILLIVAVVGAALASLLGVDSLPDVAPVSPYDGSPAVQGFLTGYQTMDLLASLTFGIVIAENIRSLGVTESGGVMREVCRAGVIAGVLMMAVYGGLAAVGFELSAQLAGATNGAAVITASATSHFGLVGTVVVAAIFLLACLNVCIGLISCCGTYFAGELPRVSYRACAIAFAAFSCAVSNLGLDAILSFSATLLGILYPPAIVLVLMGMLRRVFGRAPAAWPLTVLVTVVVSAVTGLRDALAPSLALPLDLLPLSDVGLGWVLPALLTAALTVIVSGLCGPGRPRNQKGPIS